MRRPLVKCVVRCLRLVLSCSVLVMSLGKALSRRMLLVSCVGLVLRRWLSLSVSTKSVVSRAMKVPAEVMLTLGLVCATSISLDLCISEDLGMP